MESAARHDNNAGAVAQVNKNFDVDRCRMDPKVIAGSSRARVEGGSDVIRLKDATPTGYLQDKKREP